MPTRSVLGSRLRTIIRDALMRLQRRQNHTVPMHKAILIGGDVGVHLTVAQTLKLEASV